MFQFNISSQEFLKCFCKFVGYNALCSLLQYLDVSSQANIMHMILSESQNKRLLKAILNKREYISHNWPFMKCVNIFDFQISMQ